MFESLQRNTGLVTLSAVTLSVAVTAIYHFSTERSHARRNAQRRRSENRSFEGGLREVLADGDPRKPEKPVVDVIAVHGLGSKYPKTWMKDDTMWLKDFLPGDFPNARILAFVYPSEAFDNPDFVDLRSLGGSLLRSIARDREDTYFKRKRPIIFIGHSFGGLVIKQALALSQISNPFVEGDNPYIAEATRGVLFLATPHFGSQYAFGGVWLARLLGIFGGTYSGLLQSLQLLSPQLQHLNQDFLTIPAIRNLPQRSLVCFYETKGLLFGPVVEERSACLSIATRVSLNADHKDMNKFSERGGAYDEVKYCLRRIYEPLSEAEPLIVNEHHYGFVVTIKAEEFNLFDCYPTEYWRESKGDMYLSMGNSGHSGSLIFQKKTSKERFALTFGVHNYAPWEDLSTNIGDETAQQLRDSYYARGAKRSVWSACDGARQKSKPLMAEKSVVVTFKDVEGSKQYPAEVLVQ